MSTHILSRMSWKFTRAAFVIGIALSCLEHGESQTADVPPSLPAIDPQRIHDQDAMTWADYRPIPGRHWADPSLQPARKLRVALRSEERRVGKGWRARSAAWT